MWEIKKVKSKQGQQLTKLLKDGFEPFAVTGDSDVGEVIWLRKGETVQLEAAQFEPLQIEVPDFAPMTEAMTGILDYACRVIDRLTVVLESMTELEHTHRKTIMRDTQLMGEHRVSEFGSHRELILPPEGSQVLDENTPTSNDLNSELKNSSNENTESGDTPSGEGFRVVEEIPQELQHVGSLTAKQDQAVKSIKEAAGVNVSVFLPNREGVVKVLAGSMEYLIDTVGKVQSRDTGAGTDSTLVQPRGV